MSAAAASAAVAVAAVRSERDTGGVQNRPLTGASAAYYIGAWMESARPGRGGLNASRLRADALAGGRNKRALTRLRLACARVTVRRGCPIQRRPARAVCRYQARTRASTAAADRRERQNVREKPRPRRATSGLMLRGGL